MQKSKVNVARYSPASVKVIQNTQIAIYCSCPQDSDTVKVILLALQQQKNWWNHFKSVVHLYFFMSTLTGRRASFSDHMLPKHMPNLGFVLAQRKPSPLGKTLPKAAHNTAAGLRRYRCYSTQNKLIWTSKFKFKQHKELSGMAVSICPLPSS